MLETGNGGTFGKWKLSPIISLDPFANLRDQAKNVGRNVFDFYENFHSKPSFNAMGLVPLRFTLATKIH